MAKEGKLGQKRGNQNHQLRIQEMMKIYKRSGFFSEKQIKMKYLIMSPVYIFFVLFICLYFNLISCSYQKIERKLDLRSPA